MTAVAYFAWRHEVYECEVVLHIWRDDVTPPSWYVVVRPSPNQKTWINQLPIGEHERATVIQGPPRCGPDGSVAVPQKIVRQSRAEAQADISIAALRKPLTARTS